MQRAVQCEGVHHTVEVDLAVGGSPVRGKCAVFVITNLVFLTVFLHKFHDLKHNSNSLITIVSCEVLLLITATVY